MEKDLVSVVFPTMNRRDDLIKCIKSIKSSTHKKTEIVVADNGSKDDTLHVIKKMFPDVVLIANDLNLGSPVAINNCIKASKGEFILRLDDDEIIEKDTIEKMLKVLKSSPKIGIASCLYFYTETPNILRTAGFTLDMFTGKTTPIGEGENYKGRFEGKLIEAQAVGGGSHLVRKSLFDEIGFYPESYFLHYEDVDWCLKVRQAGYKIIVVGSARLYHKRLGGASLSETPFRAYLANRGKVLFMKRNAGWRNVVFVPYLFFFIVPAKLAIYASKRNLGAAKAFARGVFDGLFKEEVFVYTKEGDKVPYIRS